MLLDSMTMLALLIALTTSIAVITLAIRQNAVLTKQNIKLRRMLATQKQIRDNYYYMDKDVAKEDAWTTK
jgi:type II secretory pathway component PulJ